MPILAAVAILALGFAWRSEPKNKVQRAANGPGGPAPEPRPDKSTAATKKYPRQKRPAASIPKAGTDDDDLDITVIKAFVIDDLVAEAAKAAADEAADSFEEPSLPQQTPRVQLSYEVDADLEEVTSPVARILICAAGDSDRGRKRPKNEDCHLVMPECSLFAVADGMGGYRGGEIASSLAIDTMREAFESSTFEGRVESKVPLPRRGRELACSIHMGNQAIRAMAQMDAELAQMGTTLVAARFSPNKQRVYIGHVGDSRCYRLRGETLRQLTTDHTLSSLGVKGAHANELFQAVGVKPDITIDLIVDKPRDDDVYLLCSDGLSKMVSDEEIRDILLSESDLEAALYGLIESANDRGGKDNVTIILVKVLARVPDQAVKLGKAAIV